jgi:hypothetical protein|tara:strand:+ start:681 stop:863 length:183 start_codon:yes stop_codon:yes gene_type:complete
MIRVRNKEHQSLGLKELKALAYDYPNDAKLGKKVRKLIQEAEKNSYQRPENAYPTPTTGG